MNRLTTTIVEYLKGDEFRDQINCEGFAGYSGHKSTQHSCERKVDDWLWPTLFVLLKYRIYCQNGYHYDFTIVFNLYCNENWHTCAQSKQKKGVLCKLWAKRHFCSSFRKRNKAECDNFIKLKKLMLPKLNKFIGFIID